MTPWGRKNSSFAIFHSGSSFGRRKRTGKHIEEHTGRTTSFGERERKRQKDKDGGRKREEGRIALYRSLILYIVPEKTRHAREKHVPVHATVDV